MAIINRLARLFKADFHAVLDHIEEPELQLKQAIREMEEELNSVNASLQQHKLELDNIADQKNAAETLIATTDDEITICFEHNNDDLARSLVRKKLETSKILASINDAYDKASKGFRTLESQHKEYAALQESMQQKADLMVKKSDSNSQFNCGFSTAERNTFAISDSDVEVALLKERQRFGSQAKAS